MVLIEGFVWNLVVVEKQKEIRGFMLYDFLRRKDKYTDDKTRIPFKLEVRGIYILGDDGRKLRITKIESEIVAWFDELPANIIEARVYQKSGIGPEANIVSLDIGKDEKADIVINEKKKFSIFHTKKDGSVYQLTTLAKYNPKTDKFEFEKKEKSN